MQMERMVMEAEIRRTHASRLKDPVVLIAYTKEDIPIHTEYINYFKNSPEGLMYGCKIEEFELPGNVEAYKAKLNEYMNTYTIKELIIIAHGTNEGLIVLARGVTATIEELRLDQPGPNGSYTRCMQCYAYNDSSAQRNQCVPARQLGINISVTSSENMPKVYRVQIANKEGQLVWVHTGLNPSLLNNQVVRGIIEDAEAKPEAEAEAKVQR